MRNEIGAGGCYQFGFTNSAQKKLTDFRTPMTSGCFDMPIHVGSKFLVSDCIPPLPGKGDPNEDLRVGVACELAIRNA